MSDAKALKLVATLFLTLAAVCLSAAPLIRAEVPGWQIALFAVVGGAAVSFLVWRWLSRMEK